MSDLCKICIHTLFEQQVEKTPDAIAVVFEDQHLTYHQLNCRANQLAHYLREQGVGPDVLVALCVERSLEMVVGILGILKAGGAYVPLDPDYPQERLAFMLQDLQTPLVLTLNSLLPRLPALEIGKSLCIDRQAQTLAGYPEYNPVAVATLDHLAYVIYTSGSTGQPKGVMMPQRPLLNLVMWQRRDLPGSPARTLQFAALSFDVAFQEMFSTWHTGGTLVLLTDSTRRDMWALLALLETSRIERLFLPFVALQHLAETALHSRTHPRFLRTIITAGEQLKITPQILQMFTCLPDCRLYNHYGPSETHVVTSFTLQGPVQSWPALPPIGQPIDNVQIHILDDFAQPVPIGVAGELYIGGMALARGYWNRPELTAERFVPDPFSSSAEARLYRTGDLARWLPDGNIEFLGRNDAQVKVRGFRIELGEIETALHGYPGVRQSVVVAQSDGTSNTFLVAYLVTEEGREPASSALQDHLRQSLPEYMVPSAYVFLDRLPLTSSGKTDRKALPAFNPQQRQRQTDYVAPRNETEAHLAELFAQVLHLDRVGVQDNFFHLGGHSLSATQLVSRIRSLQGQELPLSALFDTPTVAQLAEYLHRQDATRTELVISRDPDVAPVLSFAQEQLWFLDQLSPEQAVYAIPILLHITGRLEVQALQDALNEIVRRHEVLRTTFRLQDDLPVQHILPSLNLQLQHRNECVTSIQAWQEITQVLALPFDLEQGPLVRAHLWQTEQQEHLLLLNVHHAVADGWSMNILQTEITSLYAAFTKGHSSPLPPLTLQYADYALWQRQWLSPERLTQETDYWKQKLAGLPTLNLPLDKPRPLVQSYRGATLSQPLPEELVLPLRSLCRKQNVTLFMTLLAAFQVLLARYSGQEDIVVGSPVAGRTRTEWEPLMGFFVNMLVLRTNLAQNPSFNRVLERVRATTLEAYAHQELPFEKLVETLHPGRDMSRNPLFQVVFVVQNAEEPWQLPGLQVKQETAPTATSKFDLTLSIRETVSGLFCDWEYNTDLFEAETIARMQGHWQVLLEAVVASPETAVFALPLLTERESQQLLVEWNATETPFLTGDCLHTLFEQQVEKTPDAIAVVFEDQQLTYRELNTQADTLARWLENAGVQPETIVALFMERSIEAIVAILAILKAGGAYMPLSTHYPQERLLFMLQDSRAHMLVTTAQMLLRIPECKLKTLLFPDAFAPMEANVVLLPRKPATTANLAYVLYTSGSTGTPKAVAVEHRNVVSLVMQADYVSFGPEEVFLQLASLAFDAATFEIWGCLLHGARLVVCPIARPSLRELAEILQRERITTLLLIAGLFHEMIEAELDSLKQVHQLLAGGDILSLAQVRKYLAAPGSGRLINAYGPTEATTIACCYAVESLTAEALSVPIGRPIANRYVYILDDFAQPVPIGVAGELYIGGMALARGYWNRPELTAEKFIADPFCAESQARMYRTGDLARWLPDGNIEFLGRNDAQVKVRGFRIELGEIETALHGYPGVRQSVVVAQSDGTSNTFLVAYLVTEEGREPASSALQDHLRQSLPEYMVPSAYVFLDRLPLTSSGKTDRKALPVFNPQQRQHRADAIAPRNQTEEALLALWSELLNVKQLGVEDNFFDSGGHSLLAARLFARMEQEFGVRLPLSMLFQHPTVAALAPWLQPEERGNKEWPCLVAIQPKGERPAFFCVHSGGANVLAYRLLAQYLGADQPFFGFQAQGLDGLQTPLTSVEEMASRYIAEMRTVQPKGPYRLGGHSGGGIIAFEMARQLMVEGEQIALLALIDSGYWSEVPHYITTGRLLAKVDFHLGTMLYRLRQKPLPYLGSRFRRLHSKLRKRLSGKVSTVLGNDNRLPSSLEKVKQANYHALKAYVPCAYRGRITQLLASDMPYRTVQDPRLGWSALAEEGLEIHYIRGNHDTIMQEPHVSVLAATLRRCLDRALD